MCAVCVLEVAWGYQWMYPYLMEARAAWYRASGSGSIPTLAMGVAGASAGLVPNLEALAIGWSGSRMSRESDQRARIRSEVRRSVRLQSALRAAKAARAPERHS